MQVLELVHGLELDDVETVRQDTVGLAFEEMLGLVGGDVADGSEDVCAVSCSPLDTVAVVDATLAGLVVYVEVLQIVVEIDAASAEVSTEESGMGGEDGGYVDVTLPAERDGKTCLPLVEVGDDGTRSLAARVFAEEPCSEVAEDERLVGLVVVCWGWDTSQVPEIRLPLVHAVVHAGGVEEQDTGRTLDEPSSIEELDTRIAHAVERLLQQGVFRLDRLHLHRCRLVRKGTDERVALAILLVSDGGLGLDDGVDTPDLVSDFPCCLE